VSKIKVNLENVAFNLQTLCKQNVLQYNVSVNNLYSLHLIKLGSYYYCLKNKTYYLQ